MGEIIEQPFELKNESNLVCLTANKISVLQKALDSSNMFVIQCELDSSKSKKHPLSFGDLMMFKTISYLLSMSISKFVILANANSSAHGMKNSI